MMTLDQFGHDQFHSDTRIFKFRVIDSKLPMNSKGMVDPKIFTGENRLIADKEEDTGLWVLRYEHGIVPPVFKQRFTSFSALKKFASAYFRKRNFEIIEIVDEPKNSEYKRLG